MIFSSLNTKYVSKNNEEHAVARLVEALGYTTEIFIDTILPSAICA
jgi:hypothetical protein